MRAKYVIDSEAIEDLTGGVTSEIFTSDILDVDKFWTDEITKVNDEFLFGCDTGAFDNWQGWSFADRKDIVSMHAYSILEAREVKGERLLRLRNPWGHTEWKGAWSDGSEQWTPEWMQLLNHKFGDDGMFWISYKDLLRKYQRFDRTRLFGPDWQVTQQWTTVNVPWTADYNETKFRVTLTKPGPVVIVLSKLDDRYFQGLEGEYRFWLHFRLDRDGEQEYIVRSHGNYLMNRSVSVDLDLEPGTYSVLMKITAKRSAYFPTVEEVIKDTCKDRQEKLIQIGLAYDLAHVKGQIKETEVEKQQRLEREEKKKLAEHKKAREELRAKMLKGWETGKKRVAREKRHAKLKEEHDKKVEARRSATAKRNGALDVATNGQGEPQAATNSKNEARNGWRDVEQDVVPGKTEESKPEESKSKEGKTEESQSLENKAQEMKPQVEEAIKAPIGTESGDQPAKELEKQNGAPVEDKSTAIDEPQQAVNTEAVKETTPREKAAEFEAALKNVPSVLVNGGAPATIPGTTPAAESAPPPSTAADNDDNWEYDSLASFNSSIVTELDFAPPEEKYARPAEAVAATNPDEEDDLAEFKNNPWNAVCVVGLRVYSKDDGLSIEVVRPKLSRAGWRLRP